MLNTQVKKAKNVQKKTVVTKTRKHLTLESHTQTFALFQTTVWVIELSQSKNNQNKEIVPTVSSALAPDILDTKK